MLGPQGRRLRGSTAAPRRDDRRDLVLTVKGSCAPRWVGRKRSVETSARGSRGITVARTPGARSGNMSRSTARPAASSRAIEGDSRLLRMMGAAPSGSRCRGLCKAKPALATPTTTRSTRRSWQLDIGESSRRSQGAPAKDESRSRARGGVSRKALTPSASSPRERRRGARRPVPSDRRPSRPGGHAASTSPRRSRRAPPGRASVRVSLGREDFELSHWRRLIAAILSCTNNSNRR